MVKDSKWELGAWKITGMETMDNSTQELTLPHSVLAYKYSRCWVTSLCRLAGSTCEVCNNASLSLEMMAWCENLCCEKDTQNTQLSGSRFTSCLPYCTTIHDMLNHVSSFLNSILYSNSIVNFVFSTEVCSDSRALQKELRLTQKVGCYDK